MSEFKWVPQRNTSANYKPKVNKAVFGDGYSQRSKNGINNNPQDWANLVFKMDETELDKIETFLGLKGGVTSFTWTPPGKPEGKYLCSEWSRNYISKGVTSINAKFKQVFE